MRNAALLRVQRCFVCFDFSKRSGLASHIINFFVWQAVDTTVNKNVNHITQCGVNGNTQIRHAAPRHWLERISKTKTQHVSYWVHEGNRDRENRLRKRKMADNPPKTVEVVKLGSLSLGLTWNRKLQPVTRVLLAAFVRWIFCRLNWGDGTLKSSDFKDARALSTASREGDYVSYKPEQKLKLPAHQQPNYQSIPSTSGFRPSS